MNTPTSSVAWYCQDCGRHELPTTEKYCPECGEKMQRCSRYEWFLIDELQRFLDITGRNYLLIPQWPLADHRGFNWYFDIYVWIDGSSAFGGYGELIEVNGADHDRQKVYSGPGGGVTRDRDKWWEAFSNKRMGKQGFEARTVTNDKCAKRNGIVSETAATIVAELIQRADSWF